MFDLGLLPGCSRGYAEAINNGRSVVGYCDANHGVTHAYVWHDGVMTNLDDLIQIAGVAKDMGTNDLVAVLLTPLPPRLGDLDCDDLVNAADLASRLGGWRLCSGNTSCPTDLDADNDTDAADLAALLGAWTG